MKKYAKRLLAAAATAAAIATTPGGASAMQAPSKDVLTQSGADIGLDQAHAVWVCRYGRCWWSHGGHRHGGWGWGGHHGWGWGGHYGGWGWGGHHGWGHHGHHRRHW